MRRLLLDTNILIALSDPAHAAFNYLEQALREGAQAVTCSVAWHEYVRGPLSEEDRGRALRILESRVLPLGRTCAEQAAELYNATGRRRGSTADCLIASVAIHHECELMTLNVSDFEVFIAKGLSLVTL